VTTVKEESADAIHKARSAGELRHWIDTVEYNVAQIDREIAGLQVERYELLQYLTELRKQPKQLELPFEQLSSTGL
jgi:predicted  nucleic acid-binding Zn-ribbon protein